MTDKPNYRIQLSIIGLLLLAAYTGLQFAICLSIPFHIANTLGTVSYLLCCSAVLAMAVYGRGYVQAFAIGATIPLLLQSIQQIQYVHGLIAFLHPEGHSLLSGNASYALAQLFACMTGMTAVSVCMLVKPNGDPKNYPVNSHEEPEP